jgi:predicted nucleic acid-binding protein
VIVYVESNFVLELALQQEEHAACEQLLRFAEKTRLHLVIPAFSLAEPFSTLSRRHSERRRLKAEFDRELGQLARSVDHAKRLRSFRELTALLVDSADSDTERLESVRSRLLDVADVVPLDRPILREANILREEHDLSPPDSLVLASVLTHLETSGARSTSPTRTGAILASLESARYWSIGAAGSSPVSSGRWLN